MRSLTLLSSPLASLAKLVCYREVLSRDLLVEDREAQRLLRKHSLHRTHSRRTSSVPRQRSPSRQLSRHPSTTEPLRPSQLFRSTTSPQRPKMAHSDSERSSFESAAESLSGLANGTDLDQPLSLTDDELDRLQIRSPPLMQRSKTETDWQNVVPLEQLSLDANGPSSSSRLRSNSELVSEDDFESRLRDAEGRARASSSGSNAGASERIVEATLAPPTILEGGHSSLH